MALLSPTRSFLDNLIQAAGVAGEHLKDIQSLVTVKIEYYWPDTPFLICPNHFVWQTDDSPPFPRIMGFLGKWGRDREIKTTVSRVWLCHHLSGQGMLIQPQINAAGPEYRLN